MLSLSKYRQEITNLAVPRRGNWGQGLRLVHQWSQAQSCLLPWALELRRRGFSSLETQYALQLYFQPHPQVREILDWLHRQKALPVMERKEFFASLRDASDYDRPFTPSHLRLDALAEALNVSRTNQALMEVASPYRAYLAFPKELYRPPLQGLPRHQEQPDQYWWDGAEKRLLWDLKGGLVLSPDTSTGQILTTNNEVYVSSLARELEKLIMKNQNLDLPWRASLIQDLKRARQEPENFAHQLSLVDKYSQHGVKFPPPILLQKALDPEELLNERSSARTFEAFQILLQKDLEQQGLESGPARTLALSLAKPELRSFVTSKALEMRQQRISLGDILQQGLTDRDPSRPSLGSSLSGQQAPGGALRAAQEGARKLDQRPRSSSVWEEL